MRINTQEVKARSLASTSQGTLVTISLGSIAQEVSLRRTRSFPHLPATCVARCTGSRTAPSMCRLEQLSRTTTTLEVANQATSLMASSPRSLCLSLRTRRLMASRTRVTSPASTASRQDITPENAHSRARRSATPTWNLWMNRGARWHQSM